MAKGSTFGWTLRTLRESCGASPKQTYEFSTNVGLVIRSTSLFR